jgi:hypothetical protein
VECHELLRVGIQVKVKPLTLAGMEGITFRYHTKATILLAASVLSGHVGLAGQQGQQGIAAQLVVIVEILIPEGQPIDPLRHHLRYAVLNQLGAAMIGETARQALQQVDAPVRLAQQQGATIAGDRAAVETGRDLARKMTGKLEAGLVTLCHSRKPLLSWPKHVVANMFMPE